MILAVMSLQQWVQSNTLQDNLGGFDPVSLLAALDRLQQTAVRVLLLATEEDEPSEFIDAAKVYRGVIDLDHGSDMLFDAPVLVMRVLEDTEEDYTAAIRRAYPRIASIASPKAIVSFTSILQKIDEYPQFSFHNPGLDARHYHNWVLSYIPTHPLRETIVMYLGEVVPQRRERAVATFVAMVSQRHPNAAELGSQLAALIVEQESVPEGYIHQLKMGKMEQSVFVSRMLTLIQERIGIDLSVDEFNRIWQTANPRFDQIGPVLDQISAQKLREEGYGFEFVSFTNPIDIHALSIELRHNDASYLLANGQLVGLAGLRLSCSYIEQKSIVEMVETLQHNQSYPASFLSATTPQKSKTAHPIYIVTSQRELTPELELLATRPGVTVLLNWDRTSLHTWMRAQREIEEQSRLTVEL